MTAAHTGVVDEPLATDPPVGEQSEQTPAPSVSTTPTPTPSPEPTSATREPTPEPTREATAPPSQPVTTPTPVVTSSPTRAVTPEPSPTSTTITPAWSTPPTVTTSDLPVSMLALAFVVLLAAGAVVAALVRRSRSRTQPPASDRTAPGDAPGSTASTEPTAAATPPAAAGTSPASTPAASTSAASTSAASTSAATALRTTTAAAPGTGPSVPRTPIAVAAARARRHAGRDDSRHGRGGSPTGGLVVADVLAGSGAHKDAGTGPHEALASADETIRFCLLLGEAMIDTAAPVVQVQDALARLADANGIPDVEVVALPTALVLSTPRQDQPRTVAVGAGSRSLRLDQVQEVLEVADLARAGAVGPVEGLERVGAAMERRSPYTVWQQALGYVLSAIGLALVLGGSLTDVALAGLLGGVVVGVERTTARWAVPYQAIVVLVCAFVVATAVFSLSRTGLDVSLLPALMAPLVTFLPGAQLTTGVIDLATRQMIAGSARLAAGVMTLVLLALGIVSAANLVGIPASAITSGGGQALGWAGAWAGVGIFGVGVTIRHSAQRRAVRWIMLVLVVAYAGQLLGGALLGTQVSAFVGALAMTPVALAVARYADGPPAMVSLLPAFWLLVPGALGLVGVTSVLGESTGQGLTAVITAGTTMVAISLGVLTGLGVGSWALEAQGWLRRRTEHDHPDE